MRRHGETLRCNGFRGTPGGTRTPNLLIRSQAQGVSVLKDGEPHVDKYRSWCVGGPTLP
jgi:hypothetical protein